MTVAYARAAVEEQQHGVVRPHAADANIQRGAIQRKLLMLIDGKLLLHIRTILPVWSIQLFETVFICSILLLLSARVQHVREMCELPATNP
ncbi:MAG: hypothetical protein R2912_00275 [Eubacteriales bacterium]